MQRPWTTRCGRAAIAVTGILAGFAPPAMGQVPSRMPSSSEAQIFDLIMRVTALEEQLAALTAGKATLRVRAPFQILAAAGDPYGTSSTDAAEAVRLSTIAVPRLAKAR